MQPTSDPARSVKDMTAQAKQTIDGAAEQATRVGRQVSAVGGNFSKAVGKSLKKQPYTSLIMAGVLLEVVMPI